MSDKASTQRLLGDCESADILLRSEPIQRESQALTTGRGAVKSFVIVKEYPSGKGAASATRIISGSRSLRSHSN